MENTSPSFSSFPRGATPKIERCHLKGQILSSNNERLKEINSMGDIEWEKFKKISNSIQWGHTAKWSTVCLQNFILYSTILLLFYIILGLLKFKPSISSS